MSVKVRIPTPLRKLTNELDVVAGSAGTLGACIDGLEASYPGLKTQEAVADSLPEPIHIQPSISSFEQALSDRGLKA